MFWRKKHIYINKEVIPKDKTTPTQVHKTLAETRFDKYDMPGETSKSIRKLLLLILALFLIWFFYESIKYWNIFS